MTLEEAIGYVASDELIEVSSNWIILFLFFQLINETTSVLLYPFYTRN